MAGSSLQVLPSPLSKVSQFIRLSMLSMYVGDAAGLTRSKYKSVLSCACLSTFPLSFLPSGVQPCVVAFSSDVFTLDCVHYLSRFFDGFGRLAAFSTITIVAESLRIVDRLQLSAPGNAVMAVDECLSARICGSDERKCISGLHINIMYFYGRTADRVDGISSIASCGYINCNLASSTCAKSSEAMRGLTMSLLRDPTTVPIRSNPFSTILRAQQNQRYDALPQVDGYCAAIAMSRELSRIARLTSPVSVRDVQSLVTGCAQPAAWTVSTLATASAVFSVDIVIEHVSSVYLLRPSRSSMVCGVAYLTVADDGLHVTAADSGSRAAMTAAVRAGRAKDAREHLPTTWQLRAGGRRRGRKATDSPRTDADVSDGGSSSSHVSATASPSVQSVAPAVTAASAAASDPAVSAVPIVVDVSTDHSGSRSPAIAPPGAAAAAAAAAASAAALGSAVAGTPVAESAPAPRGPQAADAAAPARATYAGIAGGRRMPVVAVPDRWMRRETLSKPITCWDESESDGDSSLVVIYVGFDIVSVRRAWAARTSFDSAHLAALADLYFIMTGEKPYVDVVPPPLPAAAALSAEPAPPPPPRGPLIAPADLDTLRSTSALLAGRYRSCYVEVFENDVGAHQWIANVSAMLDAKVCDGLAHATAKAAWTDASVIWRPRISPQTWKPAAARFRDSWLCESWSTMRTLGLSAPRLYASATSPDAVYAAASEMTPSADDSQAAGALPDIPWDALDDLEIPSGKPTVQTISIPEVPVCDAPRVVSWLAARVIAESWRAVGQVVIVDRLSGKGVTDILLRVRGAEQGSYPAKVRGMVGVLNLTVHITTGTAAMRAARSTSPLRVVAKSPARAPRSAPAAPATADRATGHPATAKDSATVARDAAAAPVKAPSAVTDGAPAAEETPASQHTSAVSASPTKYRRVTRTVMSGVSAAAPATLADDAAWVPAHGRHHGPASNSATVAPPGSPADVAPVATVPARVGLDGFCAAEAICIEWARLRPLEPQTIGYVHHAVTGTANDPVSWSARMVSTAAIKLGCGFLVRVAARSNPKTYSVGKGSYASRLALVVEQGGAHMRAATDAERVEIYAAAKGGHVTPEVMWKQLALALRGGRDKIRGRGRGPARGPPRVRARAVPQPSRKRARRSSDRSSSMSVRSSSDSSVLSAASTSESAFSVRLGSAACGSQLSSSMSSSSASSRAYSGLSDSSGASRPRRPVRARSRSSAASGRSSSSVAAAAAGRASYACQSSRARAHSDLMGLAPDDDPSPPAADSSSSLRAVITGAIAPPWDAPLNPIRPRRIAQLSLTERLALRADIDALAAGLRYPRSSPAGIAVVAAAEAALVLLPALLPLAHTAPTSSVTRRTAAPMTPHSDEAASAAAAMPDAAAAGHDATASWVRACRGALVRRATGRFAELCETSPTPQLPMTTAERERESAAVRIKFPCKGMTSDRARLLPSTLAIVTASAAVATAAIASRSPKSLYLQPSRVTAAKVLRWARKKKATAADATGWSASLLLELTDIASELPAIVADVVARPATTWASAEAAALAWRTVRGALIPKPDGSSRPLGVASVFRRIYASVAVPDALPAAREYCERRGQFGLSGAGTEAAIMAVLRAVVATGGSVRFDDRKNSFGELSRAGIRDGVQAFVSATSLEAPRAVAAMEQLVERFHEIAACDRSPEDAPQRALPATVHVYPSGPRSRTVDSFSHPNSALAQGCPSSPLFEAVVYARELELRKRACADAAIMYHDDGASIFAPSAKLLSPRPVLSSGAEWAAGKVCVVGSLAAAACVPKGMDASIDATVQRPGALSTSFAAIQAPLSAPGAASSVNSTTINGAVFLGCPLGDEVIFTQKLRDKMWMRMQSLRSIASVDFHTAIVAAASMGGPAAMCSYFQRATPPSQALLDLCRALDDAWVDMWADWAGVDEADKLGGPVSARVRVEAAIYRPIAAGGLGHRKAAESAHEAFARGVAAAVESPVLQHVLARAPWLSPADIAAQLHVPMSVVDPSSMTTTLRAAGAQAELLAAQYAADAHRAAAARELAALGPAKHGELAAIFFAELPDRDAGDATLTAPQVRAMLRRMFALPLSARACTACGAPPCNDVDRGLHVHRGAARPQLIEDGLGEHPLACAMRRADAKRRHDDVAATIARIGRTVGFSSTRPLRFAAASAENPADVLDVAPGGREIAIDVTIHSPVVRAVDDAEADKVKKYAPLLAALAPSGRIVVLEPFGLGTNGAIGSGATTTINRYARAMALASTSGLSIAAAIRWIMARLANAVFRGVTATVCDAYGDRLSDTPRRVPHAASAHTLAQSHSSAAAATSSRWHRHHRSVTLSAAATTSRATLRAAIDARSVTTRAPAASAKSGRSIGKHRTSLTAARDV